MATELMGKWEQDETGQWWNIYPTHRAKAVEQTCEACHQPFIDVPSKRRRFCSIRCANRSISHVAPRHVHAILDVKHARIQSRGGKLWYGIDTKGQWWELRNEKPWTRVTWRVCVRCGREFPERTRRAREVCSRRCGALQLSERRGGRGTNWKGGRLQWSDGYILIYHAGHPNGMGPGKQYVREHRLVMESILGRYLHPWEQVHHLNGDKADNRPENLELWMKKQPVGTRLSDMINFMVTHYRTELQHALDSLP